MLLLAGSSLGTFCSAPGRTLHFILGFIIKSAPPRQKPRLCHFDVWSSSGPGPQQMEPWHGAGPTASGTTARPAALAPLSPVPPWPRSSWGGWWLLVGPRGADGEGWMLSVPEASWLFLLPFSCCWDGLNVAALLLLREPRAGGGRILSPRDGEEGRAAPCRTSPVALRES